MRRLLVVGVLAVSSMASVQALSAPTCYKKGDSPDQAIAACTARIQSSRQSRKSLAKDYLARGHAYADKGDREHAIADYSEAMGLDPKYVSPAINRGVVYLSSREFDRAIVDFKRALNLCRQGQCSDFGKQLVFLNLGDSYYGKKQFNRAIANYNEAIRINPKRSYAYMKRGLAYANTNDFARAKADFLKTTSLDPGNPESWANFCAASAIIGQEFGKTRAACNRAVQLRPDANDLGSRGLMYLRFGHYDDAIADYNAALKLVPKTASSLYGRGFAELKKGETATGERDMSAAEAVQKDIAHQMADWGIK